MTDRQFKKYIASRMKDSGKVDALAAELGVSRTTIYNWANGDKPSRMALTMVERLAASNIGLHRKTGKTSLVTAMVEDL